MRMRRAVRGPRGPSGSLVARSVCVVAALAGRRPHFAFISHFTESAAIGRQGRAIKKIKVTQ